MTLRHAFRCPEHIPHKNRTDPIQNPHSREVEGYRRTSRRSTTRTHLDTSSTDSHTQEEYQKSTGFPRTWPRSWPIGTACRTPSKRLSWQRSGRRSVSNSGGEWGCREQVKVNPTRGFPPGVGVYMAHIQNPRSPLSPTAITAQRTLWAYPYASDRRLLSAALSVHQRAIPLHLPDASVPLPELLQFLRLLLS